MPAPSIIGTWTFTNFTGNDSFHYSPQTLNAVTNYAYNGGTKLLTASTIDSGIASYTRDITVTTETWTFNANNTYTISETYQVPGNPAQTTTSTGSWNYVDNAGLNTQFFLYDSALNVIQLASNVFEYIAPLLNSSGVYSFKVTDNTMVISDNLSQYYTSGYIGYANIDITFTKQ